MVQLAGRRVDHVADHYHQGERDNDGGPPRYGTARVCDLAGQGGRAARTEGYRQGDGHQDQAESKGSDQDDT